MLDHKVNVDLLEAVVSQVLMDLLDPKVNLVMLDLLVLLVKKDVKEILGHLAYQVVKV